MIPTRAGYNESAPAPLVTAGSVTDQPLTKVIDVTDSTREPRTSSTWRQPTDAEYREQQLAMHMAEIAAERQAFADLRAALTTAADIAISNWMQRFGDGEGGVILDEWRNALEERLGHPLAAPPVPRKPGIAPPLTKRECLAVFDRDGYRCLHCGTQSDLSVDHKTPRSKGGTNDPENLQTLCRPCNTKKGTKVE